MHRLGVAIVLLFLAAIPASAQTRNWSLKWDHPVMRDNAAMAYDAARGQMVLFGGQAPPTASGFWAIHDDTWVFDGWNWIKKEPVHKPHSRSNHAMAYDPVRRQVILFGGIVQPPTGSWRYGDDMWAWDGNDWIEITPATRPPLTAYAKMALDTRRNRVVMFGGMIYTGSYPKTNDTWEWDGVNWTLLNPKTRPPTRTLHGMAYDATRGYTILYGGAGNTDTWTWDGVDWTLVGSFHGPAARTGIAMAYDAERRQVLLFGGNTYGPVNELWAWNGTYWTQFPATGKAPIGRTGAVMAYDPVRGLAVLFGGYKNCPASPDSPDMFDDTWFWNGTEWSSRWPANRVDGAMAYDAARQQTVLFGGYVADWSVASGADYSAANDTWTWDGNLWTARDPAHKPSVRRAAAMVYDAARQKVLLFGGRRKNHTVQDTILGDMWSWDGNDWTQLTPPALPPGRHGARMVYDSARQRVILFGGMRACDSSGGGHLNDTWSWNGTTWTQLTPATQPARRRLHAMTYDPVRGEVVMFGGESAASICGHTYGSYNDTWVLGAGNNWVRKSPATVPYLRQGEEMVWHAGLGKAVLMGSDFYAWDGTNWSALTPATVPPWRTQNSAAYDAARDQIVRFGGNLSGIISTDFPTGDTWVYGATETDGSVHVNTNRPGAFYTITGAATYSGSGVSSSWLHAPPGSYSIVYNTVAGYDTPPAETRVLAAGSSIGFLHAYTARPGTLSVVTNQAAASFTLRGPLTYSGQGAAFSQANAPAAAYTISYGPVAGYIAPPPETRTLEPGGGVLFTGSYAVNPATTGTVTVGTNLGSAAFTVTGPVSFSGSGTSFTRSSLPPGVYAIAYSAVAGYTTPPGTSATLAAGATVEFSGTYRSLTSAGEPGWVLKSPAPHGRTAFASVYDAARQQIVMFGGTRGNLGISETWVYANSIWTRVRPVHNPPAQENPLMVYDAARQRVVLYGRTDRQTWLWDGADWTQAAPATVPPAPDYLIAMAYDAARQRTILTLGIGEHIQTWSWDGANWQRLTPATVLPLGVDGYMAYDAARAQTVLYVYAADGSSGWIEVYDTWVWNGVDWSLKARVPADLNETNPVALYPGRMEYDAARQQIVLPNGQNTWLWDGSAWTKRTPATSPTASGGYPVYDPVSTRLLLLGGTSPNGAVLGNDIWSWDGVAWTQRAATPSYPVRYGASQVYDGARGEIVLFGGRDLSAGYTGYSETWIWNGTGWKEKKTAVVPRARSDAGMAFDSARGQVVLFGGDNWWLYLNDTWVWDGAAWTEKTLTVQPEYRRGHMMVYDAARGVTLLFGGRGLSGLLNDTWTWNGAAWTRLTPVASPPARELGALAFDSARGRVVLFGGSTGSSTRLNDTWEWDGANWTQIAPAAIPSARQSHGMAFDALRGQTLLYGGYAGSYYLQDTWAWNGSNWTQKNPADTPPAAIASLTYDAARAEVVAFGGRTVLNALPIDVWVWTDSPASGTVSTTANLAAAAFAITGPTPASGSGVAWSRTGMTPGDYTIVWQPVSGYLTPPPETKTLAAGATLLFTGAYVAATGTITVSTNLAGATFTISGAASYSGSGTSWSQGAAPPGTYTITYNAVAGYATPAPETKTLAAGATLLFTGAYPSTAAGITVSTNLAGATFTISGAASYSGSGIAWSQSGAPPGTYTITYNAVAGYATPAPETKALAAGATLLFTGTYLSTTGAITVSTNLAAATFTISGAASYSGSGIAWSQSGAPQGTYTITYNAVAGYATPAPETKALVAGATLAFTGAYLSTTGAITVSSNLAGVTFTISGAASYSGSGIAWSQSGAPPGTYTITYNAVAGYATPAPETKTLAAGATLAFNGSYTVVTGAITVSTNLAAATFTMSGAASYSGSGIAWSQGAAPQGTYTITYNAVAGYATPAPETRTLAAGATLAFNGSYAVLTGTIVVTANVSGAAFTLHGPADYSGSGQSWSRTDAPAGSYTIAYAPLAGYSTPPSETRTLAGAGTLTFNALYAVPPAPKPVSFFVDPNAVSFACEPGGGPRSQTLEVSGTAGVTFSVRNVPPWLTVASSRSGTPANVTLTVNCTGLNPAPYFTLLTFAPHGPGADPSTVAVSLWVRETPRLIPSRSAIEFWTRAGTPPPPALLHVVAVTRNLDCTATSPAGWLRIAGQPAATPLALTLTVDPAGLSPGTYATAITVACREAANSPLTVPVTLTIAPAP